MDFTGSELEIHTVQDFEVFVRNLGMKVSNRKDTVSLLRKEKPL